MHCFQERGYEGDGGVQDCRPKRIGRTPQTSNPLPSFPIMEAGERRSVISSILLLELSGMSREHCVGVIYLFFFQSRSQF